MKFARATGVILSTASIAFLQGPSASAAGRGFLSPQPDRQDQRATAAREQLSALKVPYTEEAFVSSAARGDDRVVDLFLDSGLSPDAKNRDGFTALMWSAGQDHLSVVKKLLARGATTRKAATSSTMLGEG